MDSARQQVFGLNEPGPIVAIDSGGVAPVSAVYLWIRRGAASETDAQLGAAHLLEHMLFKGAGDHGLAEAATRIEGLGGDLNAYTSYEQTVLHATLPAGREVEVIDVLAQMALGPHLDDAELRREQDVVVEEIRGALDDPSDRLAEAVRARVHSGHPYGRPILGHEETVRGFDAAALQAFHSAHYRPEHAILAVAGPVEVERIRACAARCLASSSGVLAPPTRPPAQLQAGALVIDGFEERLLELAWPLPGVAHEDIAALDVLATALGSGDAAVLSRVLRDEEGHAVDAWAALESEPDRGLLVVGAMARKGHVPECARSLARQVARIAHEGLPGAALRRARTAILASRLYERETVDGRAHRLAWYLATFGDLEAEALYEARVRAVRPDDIVRVARTWLGAEKCVAGAVARSQELTQDQLQQAVLSGAAASPRSARPARGLVRHQLSCGATVLVEADPHAELAACSVVGVGGLLAEPSGGAGTAGVWAQTVIRGAGHLDPAELASAVEDRAGTLRAWRARNSVGLDLRMPHDHLIEGIDLLGAVLTRPSFLAHEVDLARADIEEARASLLHDDPAGMAWHLAWQSMFPGHPWGRLSLGSPSSVARITPRSVRAYHRRVIQGRNLVLAFAGAVDADEVIARLERRLADLAPGAPINPQPPTVPQQFLRHRRRTSDREQAHVVLGFPAVGHGDPLAPAQRLLEGVLAGQSGRLFLELRERQGLAYSVDATAVEGLGGGALLVSAAVDPDRVDAAMQAMWRVFKDLRENLLSAAELQRVRARVVDGAVLGLQRAAHLAGHLAAAERYGPGAEQWRERLSLPGLVSAEALREAARRLLPVDRGVTVEVGSHVAD